MRLVDLHVLLALAALVLGVDEGFLGRYCRDEFGRVALWVEHLVCRGAAVCVCVCVCVWVCVCVCVCVGLWVGWWYACIYESVCA